MKKTLFILCLLLTSLGLSAQILPVEQVKEVKPEDRSRMNEQLKGITYVKDVNGVLNKFVGTWKGTFNGKQLELIVKKYTRDYSPFVDRKAHPEDLLWDELIAKWKITDQNGTVIYSTLNESDDTNADEVPKIMYKYAFYDLNTYAFDYVGENYQCGDNGNVYLFFQNSTKIHFSYLHSGKTSSECISSVGAVFPTDSSIVLTKQ